MYIFYLGFLSRTLTIHWTAGEERGCLFYSSLPLPPASQTLRHWPGNYYRYLITAHSQEPDSNWEILVSESKSTTTKIYENFSCVNEAYSELNSKILI